jgi:hypothetical protein
LEMCSINISSKISNAYVLVYLWCRSKLLPRTLRDISKWTTKLQWKLQYFSLCHDGFLSDRKVRKNFAVVKFTRHINRVTSFNIKVCNLTSLSK